MTFWVEHVSGSARFPPIPTQILGVVETVYPEQAVLMFANKTQATEWVFNKGTRTNTHVKLENPISFISDHIDYISATGGTVIRDKKNRIKFTVMELEPEYPEGEVIVNKKTIRAENVKDALKQGVKDFGLNCSDNEITQSIYFSTVTGIKKKTKKSRRIKAIAVLEPIKSSDKSQ